MNEWLVWQEAQHRQPKAAITKEDIPAAISWFQGITGKKPFSIGLNKCNIKFYTPSDDLVLVVIGGVSRCEIWLSDTDMSPYYRQPVAQDAILSPQDEQETALQPEPMKTVTPSYETTNKPAEKHAGGRPKKTGEVSRTTEWRRAKQLEMAL